MSWTQPVCERDWCLQNGGEEGPWREPVRVVDPDRRGAEQCAVCGFPTWAGIFFRVDPATVPYPRSDDGD